MIRVNLLGEEPKQSRAEYMRRYYAANRQAWRENQRRHRAAMSDAERLVGEARIRARRKGLPFDLVPDDVTVPEVCPILDIRLVRGQGRIQDASPTLDRIDPVLGYVRGNVAVISARANLIKNSGSADEHERIAAWIRKQKEARS